MELKVSNLNELPIAAEKILEIAGDNRIFLFYGEMGAGKTTLIKALCDALNVDDAVSSPTFSIVNEYSGNNEIIYHFDFYRIKNENEAFDLGYEDYLFSGNYCFIEWPEKISNLLPDKFMELKLLETSENERVIKMQMFN
ncbi:tRNA (adenosine(37)-N6)-threonylcarbamoyltransferase complex ATPase subunit type 1 TsaE [Pedobacter sp. P351]|uniref:tRNA (adenosine(37)-N6)-threonylcarbamoyltransferase complex ATPase subunit type 1 TsaE n=1 Tax=Pedobacter superstes TaxID=3133441 RepID=UPI0030B11A5C